VKEEQQQFEHTTFNWSLPGSCASAAGMATLEQGLAQHLLGSHT
jgi:hypothetical protein